MNMKILDKPVGVTSNEFIALLKKEKKLKSKACYCGRLDPMARGKMLILEGEECKQMKLYLGNDKVYEFEIILGISTDTDDCLGILEKIDMNSNNVKLFEAIDIVKKSTRQKFHTYSSYVLRKHNERKPLWEWHKLGLLNDEDIPSKEIKIHSLDYIQKKYYTGQYILSKFCENIMKIDSRHKFRQESILLQWKQLLQNTTKLCFTSYKFRIHVSSGFYVRQFIYDLKTYLDFPLLVYDINRIDH